jgi:hypothetical protein
VARAGGEEPVRGLGPKVTGAAAWVSEQRGSVVELVDAAVVPDGTIASCRQGGSNGFWRLPAAVFDDAPCLEQRGAAAWHRVAQGRGPSGDEGGSSSAQAHRLGSSKICTPGAAASKRQREQRPAARQAATQGMEQQRVQHMAIASKQQAAWRKASKMAAANGSKA